MKQPVKKRILQVALIALFLSVLFLPSLKFENLKAYLNISGGTYITETVWGQAYSPNIGWINFYCDGANNARPASATSGAATMTDSCGSIPYQTEYDPITQNFSGVAYSTNYGWLDMSGLAMNTPVSSLSLAEVTGDSINTTYNFGVTSFTANSPAFNPGVRYYNSEGYFCGFAYSTEAGYISFCDPQTKERAPNNVSVPGYDWDSYAVYMGAPETTIIGGGDCNPNAPQPSLGSIVFAADDSLSYDLCFFDPLSGTASAEAHIMDSNSVVQNYTDSDFIGINTVCVHVVNHDFRTADDYDLTYSTCDNAANCSTDCVDSNFFQVVANVPVWDAYDSGDPTNPLNCNAASTVNCPSGIADSHLTGGTMADGLVIADGSAIHSVEVTLADRYGNPVISETGIKEVEVEFAFDNTTKLNQIANTGDSAIFTSADLGLSQAGGTSTGILTETNDDGIFRVDISSLAPTSIGYSPIAADGFKLDFDKINLDVNPIAPYSNSDVGGLSGTSTTDANPNIEFAFAPTVIATPTAMTWDGSNYITDPEGAENITVNAAKRFNTSFYNQSTSIDVTNPKIGIALYSGADIDWNESVIETANSVPNLEESFTLDTDSDSLFDGSWKDLSGWITGISASSTDATLRFRATPELLTAAAGDLDTTLQSYSCYTIGGTEVCHRSELLEGSATTSNLSNPGIEILGSVRSIDGTESKTDSSINQSIGDFVQNEFKSIMNRNLAPLINDATSPCNSNTTITTTAEFEALNCRFNNNSVVYFENADLTINLAAGETLPDEAWTIVINGGDLSIESDLEYPSRDSSLGIILLQDSSDEHGNVFVYPGVTNLVGAVYAEGGVISVNSLGFFGEDSSSSCNGLAGFCDRSYELRNQLYWKGLLATANTIGGSDKTPAPQCPSNILPANCDSETARIYDFAYLRTYHVGAGGTPAVGTTSPASFVMEYDARIQNNPPPLFEVSGGGNSTEI